MADRVETDIKYGRYIDEDRCIYSEECEYDNFARTATCILTRLVSGYGIRLPADLAIKYPEPAARVYFDAHKPEAVIDLMRTPGVNARKLCLPVRVFGTPQVMVALSEVLDSATDAEALEKLLMELVQRDQWEAAASVWKRVPSVSFERVLACAVWNNSDWAHLDESRQNSLEVVRGLLEALRTGAKHVTDTDVARKWARTFQRERGGYGPHITAIPAVKLLVEDGQLLDTKFLEECKAFD